jgi:hypothetical protein
MNISIDTILGSAKKINSQRNADNIDKKEKSKLKSGDSVEITTRVDARLDAIQKNLKDVQHSLTRNQIVKNGLAEIQEQINNGGGDIKNLYEDVTFNDEKVLLNFLDGKDPIELPLLGDKQVENEKLIKEDIAKLTRLQVETENILASNLGGSQKVDSTLEKLEDAFEKTNAGYFNSISNLNADVVMKLIR